MTEVVAGPPEDPAAQLRWLVDRAAISDLLIDFARALDERDWRGYARNYTHDGELAISETIAHKGREGLAEFVAASLSAYPGGTHHVSTNHAISIDTDVATARAYLISAHVFDDLRTHADGAGWYDVRLSRTSEGWKFAYVTLTIRYRSGEPMKPTSRDHASS